jgi:hypothetical protein
VRRPALAPVAAGVPRLSLNGCVGEDKNGG